MAYEGISSNKNSTNKRIRTLSRLFFPSRKNDSHHYTTPLLNDLYFQIIKHGLTPGIQVRKKRLFVFAAFFLALLSAIFSGELLLRWLPIADRHQAFQKDKDISRIYIPHSLSSYKNARGDYVIRKANHLGFLDVAHDSTKPADVYRIGFFGDSYTEAIQVPLDSTYFRLVESNLQEKRIECLAFGISGFGTLQSYLNCLQQMDRFDLDLVVYQFCKNDPGDNIREIKQQRNLAYATLQDGELIIDNSFRERIRTNKSWSEHLHIFMQSRSLLYRTVYQRINLLSTYGVKTNISKKDRVGGTKTRRQSKLNIPNQNDPPSQWPDSLKQHALQVDSLIITKWQSAVLSSKRDFAILYVPRKGEWRTDSSAQDSWRPWLKTLCAEKQICFIDPTTAFITAEAKGIKLYYDHFTPIGHKIFAGVFSDWFTGEEACGKQRPE